MSNHKQNNINIIVLIKLTILFSLNHFFQLSSSSGSAPNKTNSVKHLDRVLLHVVAQFHEKKKTFPTLKPSCRFPYHLVSWNYQHTWLGPWLLQKLLGCSICQLGDHVRIDSWDAANLQFDLPAVISLPMRYSLVTIENHWEKRLFSDFQGWSKNILLLRG